MSLAREGDQPAFEQLVIRRQSALRSMLRRMCGNDSLADDLAQQTFLTAFLNISSLKNESAFAGWLRTIAVNGWLQHCRKHDLLANSDEAVDAPSAATTVSLGLDLNTALLTLSALERTCVVLNYQEGLSHGEVAALLDRPLGTVKSHISRGAKKLQESLRAYAKTESTDD